MGASAAREAAEVFYRSAPAYLETLDAELLEDYLDTDNFDVGVSPRNHITSVTIFLDTCTMQSKSQWGYGNGRPSALHLTDDALDAIFGFNPLKLPGSAMRILEISRKLYDQLTTLGANITVVYRYDNKYGGKRVEPIILGEIMKLPQAEWEPHFVNESQKQDPKSSEWVRSHVEAALRYEQSQAAHGRM